MKRILSAAICLLILCASLAAPVHAALSTANRNLIDSAPLTPLVTGYTVLDQTVANFFASNFSSSADTYDKLKICYDFLIYGSTYGSSTVTSSLYNAIAKECNYYSSADSEYAAEAYAFIKSKKGSCNDFSSAFMVMARAIGLECYVMHGTITWYAGTTPHYWCLIKLNGAYYIFDPQAEWRNYSNNGSVSYSNFCVTEAAGTSRSCDRDACIREFGNFQCRNKVNNPGTVIPPTNTPVTNSYTTGVYRTNEQMNFRSDHSTAAGIYTVLPSGITVTVTEVYGSWGRITYNGTTGWISLEYSTKLKDSVSTEPETTQPAATAYRTGLYVTNEPMNFRANHSESAAKYFVIPAGTVLTITEIYGVWGKANYKGRTGWMSLEYSTYQGTAQQNASYAAGDADGDGKVTAGDARLILRHCVSLETIKNGNLNSADVNGDGKITPEDARITLRKAVHLQ